MRPRDLHGIRSRLPSKPEDGDLEQPEMVRAALRYAGAEQGELELFMREATAGDYDELLATVMRWVVVE